MHVDNTEGLQLRCIDYLSRALQTARQVHARKSSGASQGEMSERNQSAANMDDESPVHKATTKFIYEECSRVEWLAKLNMAQLSLVINSASYIADKDKREYATCLDSIMPHLLERLDSP